MTMCPLYVLCVSVSFSYTWYVIRQIITMFVFYLNMSYCCAYLLDQCKLLGSEVSS